MPEAAWPSLVLDLRGSGEITADALAKRLEEKQRTLGQAPGVLLPTDGALLGTLRKLRREGTAFDVFAVVPHLTLYVRLVSQLGAPLAGLTIARLAGLPALVQTGFFSLKEVRGVLGNDFRAVMRILFEFELSQLAPLRPACVFLHPQITDLALAFGNSGILTDFKERAAAISKTGQSGFGTNNLGLLADRCAQWHLPPSPVLAPFNPEGFLMKPDRSRCETVARQPGTLLMADRIRVAPGSDEDARRYLQGFPGIKACVIDSPELDRCEHV